MRRPFTSLLTAIAAPLFVFVLFACQQNQIVEDSPKKLSKMERIQGALDHEFEITKDLDLGYPPQERLVDAYRVAEERLQKMATDRSPDELSSSRWESRGPDNVGGRTRAIHIDIRDPERKKIWIGGVSGGLWVSEDITQNDPQWRVINDFWANLMIGGIGQDPGNPEIMYVGTGEVYASLRGMGVFKSIDGGETWEQLPSTLNSIYNYVQDVFVHPSGDVYVATGGNGVYRSQNGGDTWGRVLSVNRVNDIHYVETTGEIFASDDRSIFKTTTGNSGDWENIGTNRPGFPTGLTRLEFTICQSNPEVLYLVGSRGGSASNVYATFDGGQNWTEKPVQGGDFTNGQAWYDLDIAVDPFNCFALFMGGVPLLQSGFQGNNWDRLFSLHVDHHNHTYDPENRNVVYFGNDGGIWRTENNAVTIQDKNKGYITTQFYSGAIHPGIGVDYFLGGTQDNNSLQMSGPGIVSANNVNGGDGVFAFIDQNEPNIQIASSQFGNYVLSTNGFQSTSGSAGVSGSFINVSDYDNDANILYGQTSLGDFFRWNINTLVLDYPDIEGLNINVSAVYADPNVENRLYMGVSGGRILRIDNAHEGEIVQAEVLADFAASPNIVSIYLDTSNAEHILVTLSNYGLSNNVYVSYNNGDNFQGFEGNLPDMPVRWGLFDPSDHSRAIIATQLGVWSTEKIDGNFTKWNPSNTDNGLPFVRTDMLQMRSSDNTVLAATYGRGFWTSDLFTQPRAVINVQDVYYLGDEITFDGTRSPQADNYLWDFGDGGASSDGLQKYTYQNSGEYVVTLTINGDVSASKRIYVLPTLEAPYEGGEPGYNGGFETNDFHFVGLAKGGSTFKKGKTDRVGKSGTNSGDNAFVLGLTEDFYQPNSESYLYTPGFDLSEVTLYSLSFFAKYEIHNRFDGFKLEYSTDRGGSWKQLGNSEDPDWYNYLNENLTIGAFQQGESYFTNVSPDFKEFTKDISALSGEPFVSFRFVFKSEGTGLNIGLALDDFEITKFSGVLETRFTNLEAGYSAESEVTVDWTTSPEFQAKKFELERSYNGIDYEIIATRNATGRTTQIPQTYSHTSNELRPIIFFKIHSFNENTDIDYNLDFYSPTMVVRRNIEDIDVFKIFPNPFSEVVNVSFTDVITEEVEVRLFDDLGRLLYERKSVPQDVFIQIENLNVPAGLYFLNIKIGDRDDQTFKLYGGQ